MENPELSTGNRHWVTVGSSRSPASQRGLMKKLGLFLSWVLALVSLARPAEPQVPPEKIRLAYSAIGGSQASFWIPYEAGIFRKHGLDVELLYFAGGGVINANLAGGDLVVIASSMNVMTFVVMARPEIKRPEDLKGKKIGVSRF